jgi:hypothetical protein
MDHPRTPEDNCRRSQAAFSYAFAGLWFVLAFLAGLRGRHYATWGLISAGSWLMLSTALLGSLVAVVVILRKVHLQAEGFFGGWLCWLAISSSFLGWFYCNSLPTVRWEPASISIGLADTGKALTERPARTD